MRNSTMHRGCWPVMAVAMLLLTGCSNEPTNAPASGKVIVKGGIPLDEGRLFLIPDPPNESRKTCEASIGTDGSFTCYSPIGGEGIPPGKYKVVLGFGGGKGNVSPYAKAFAKYTNPETTDLKLEVPPGGRSGIVIEVEEST